MDESAFSRLPGVVRTSAPKGQTPTLRAPLTRAHLSAVSALTPAGRLFLQVPEPSLRGDDVVRFLRHLPRLAPGTLLVIRGGSPRHRSRVITDLLAAGAARRPHLERLPAYAPELNPDEGIWRYLEHVELRNLCGPTRWDLDQAARLAARRLRRKPHVIRACFAQAGCL